MTDKLDLNAYFERIGFAGSIAPTVETLAVLHALQPAAIPFENLSPLLGEKVLLDQASLNRKLLFERRGGYCFELNMLLKRVLEALEFEVTAHSARVVWGRSADAIVMRDHMFLMVEIGGVPWLADVGFGGMTPTAPLKFRPGLEQDTPNGSYRVTGDGPEYLLEGKVGSEWQALYRFDLVPHHEIDFEAPNHYLATHPDSGFRQQLRVARAEPGRRLALRGRLFSIYNEGGEPEKRELTSVAEIKDVLAGPFRIGLPAADQLDPLLERLLAEA